MTYCLRISIPNQVSCGCIATTT